MPSGKNGRLNLHVGELVEVKSEAEILATLDQEGKLQSLPFMPEMLQYCGRRFRVLKRADKTCDTIQGTWRRRMQDAVHLDLRCDGHAHDGCQALCLLFWKEAWLRRAQDGVAVPIRASSPSGVARNSTGTTTTAPRCTREALTAACRSVNEAGETVYMLSDDGTAEGDISPDMVARGTVRERCAVGNVTLADVIRGTLIGVFNKAQVLLSRSSARAAVDPRRSQVSVHRWNADENPQSGSQSSAGDLVEVRSKDEIVATLDSGNRNRGLLFDREMVGYCGRRMRVLSRVNRIIDERSGKMCELNSDCLILEGAYCRGGFNQFCPRGIYSFWREIWLKKVAPPLGARESATSLGSQTSVALSMPGASNAGCMSAVDGPPCAVLSPAQEQTR